MSEQALVIAGRESIKRDKLPSDVIPGAKVIVGDCGCRVWVSPATQAMIDYGKGKSYVSCIECIMDDPEQVAGLAASFINHGVNAAPGALSEIDKHVGIAERKAMEAHFNLRERNIGDPT